MASVRQQARRRREPPAGRSRTGSFDDYDYNLTAKNKRITITLADSDPYQDELRTIVESGELSAETAISPRTSSRSGSTPGCRCASSPDVASAAWSAASRAGSSR